MLTVTLKNKGVSAASDLRRDVGSAFDDMEARIQDVETYLAMFPDDQNVLDASVDLVVSIIQAFEHVIGYYIKSKRGFPKQLSLDKHPSLSRLPARNGREGVGSVPVVLFSSPIPFLYTCYFFFQFGSD